MCIHRIDNLSLQVLVSSPSSTFDLTYLPHHLWNGLDFNLVGPKCWKNVPNLRSKNGNKIFQSWPKCPKKKDFNQKTKVLKKDLNLNSILLVWPRANGSSVNMIMYLVQVWTCFKWYRAQVVKEFFLKILINFL